jgi:hypothetical protein
LERTLLTTWLVTAKYRRRDTLGSGEDNTVGLVMSPLSSSSTFCVSFIQRKESDFFSSLYRGSPDSQPGHKMAKGHEAPHESLNVLDVPNWTHVSDGRDLVKVRFDAALGDDVT